MDRQSDAFYFIFLTNEFVVQELDGPEFMNLLYDQALNYLGHVANVHLLFLYT